MPAMYGHSLPRRLGGIIGRRSLVDYNAVDLRFDDKTSLTFVIRPGFTVEPEYTDWKTGKYRPVKRWPPLHGQP
jgi:hypothetical protein